MAGAEVGHGYLAGLGVWVTAQLDQPDDLVSCTARVRLTWDTQPVRALTLTFQTSAMLKPSLGSESTGPLAPHAAR